MPPAAEVHFEVHKESNLRGRLTLRGGVLSVGVQFGNGARRIVVAIVLTMVRSRDPLLKMANVHADRAICIDLLRNWGIGFVQKVLTFARERRGSLIEMSRRLDAGVGSTLYELARKIEPRSGGLDFCHNAHDVSVFGATTSK